MMSRSWQQAIARRCWRSFATLYRDDPDPGLHAAVEWLLRKWKQDGVGQAS